MAQENKVNIMALKVIAANHGLLSVKQLQAVMTILDVVITETIDQAAEALNQEIRGNHPDASALANESAAKVVTATVGILEILGAKE